MRRIIVVLAALAVVAAACGDSAEETSTAPTTEPATTQAPPPTTATTTTTTIVAPAAAADSKSYEPGVDGEADAAVEAFTLVFDSATTYEEKLPYLAEPEGLEETVAGYQETGTQFGGVAVEVSAVSIDGAVATIEYALLFSGNPSYTGLEGTAVHTDDGWQVDRKMFCSLMNSARVGCPSE